jgi:hypothetical protein
MQKVPYDIWTQYEAFLKTKVKNVSQHENLKKWFLFFWDFRSKYHPQDSRSEQVRLFIEKLQDKGQSQVQQKQAAHAVSLYFQMHDAETKAATTSTASHYPADGEGSLQKKVSDSALTLISPPFSGYSTAALYYGKRACRPTAIIRQSL